MARKSGKLKIGNQWNAIKIIAFSQANPFKSIAELVENSIDAHARSVTIVKGKSKGSYYLKIIDDGDGIPLDSEGRPNFAFVATHICDSLKKRLKDSEKVGIHGQFGIGLLGFWALGESLKIISKGIDGLLYEMKMERGSPDFHSTRSKKLISAGGTEVHIENLHESNRKHLSGEKIQKYLAAELRDRLKKSGLSLQVHDKVSRKHFDVKPIQYEGRRLFAPKYITTTYGELLLELFYNPSAANQGISVCRDGTRILSDLLSLEGFHIDPWRESCLEGLVDYPALRIAATREQLVRDHVFDEFCLSLHSLEDEIASAIDEMKKIEEEKASRQIQKQVQRALMDALRTMPEEDYLWFDIPRPGAKNVSSPDETLVGMPGGKQLPTLEDTLFPIPAGPLHFVRIIPKTTIIRPGSEKSFTAHGFDDQGIEIDTPLIWNWNILSGEGRLEGDSFQIVFIAPQEEGVTKLGVEARQQERLAEAYATIRGKAKLSAGYTEGKGLPHYVLTPDQTGEWRSRYDRHKNYIEINSLHKDYLEAKEKSARLKRYIGKIYAKEIILLNFPDIGGAQACDRMIELLQKIEERL
jgi:hypothetical protein